MLFNEKLIENGHLGGFKSNLLEEVASPKGDVAERGTRGKQVTDNPDPAW